MRDYQSRVPTYVKKIDLVTQILDDRQIMICSRTLSWHWRRKTMQYMAEPEGRSQWLLSKIATTFQSNPRKKHFCSMQETERQEVALYWTEVYVSEYRSTFLHSMCKIAWWIFSYSMGNSLKFHFAGCSGITKGEGCAPTGPGNTIVVMLVSLWKCLFYILPFEPCFLSIPPLLKYKFFQLLFSIQHLCLQN